MDNEWFPIKNGSVTDTIPAFGVVRPTGFEESTGSFIVDSPVKGSANVLFIVGEGSIDPGAYGKATADMRCIAAYYVGDYASGVLPAVGDELGTAPTSFYLHAGRKGFVVLGGAYMGVANVIRTIGGALNSDDVVTDVQCVAGELVVTYNTLTARDLTLS